MKRGGEKPAADRAALAAAVGLAAPAERTGGLADHDLTTGLAPAEDDPGGGLAPAERGMLDFAVKLALTPRAVSAADLEALRALGFDDAAIHDVVQITGLFSYYNRLASGLGVDPEPDW